MDLRDYPIEEGIEARFASVEGLKTFAGNIDDELLKGRLLTAAALKEILEARDGEIIDGLIGRLDTGVLDDVTIVLEMTTQQTVEEELRTGELYRPGLNK